MIVDLLFGVVRVVVGGIVNLLPTATIPNLSAEIPTLSSLWAGFGWMNQYFPVDALVTMLGLLTATWAALQAVNGIVWLLSKLHVLGGGSQ